MRKVKSKDFGERIFLTELLVTRGISRTVNPKEFFGITKKLVL
jgi:hypothetical protein